MTPPSAELLLSHAAFLRGLARGLLRDEQAAEDAAQDAMVAAIERPPAPGNLRAWLARVTRNLAVSSHRSRQRRLLRERFAARRESTPSVADDVARLELQRRVVDAVLGLDEPYRGVVVHRYFDGLSIRAIARRLDVPVETVRTRLRRAHALLRGTLDAEHGGRREAWALGLFVLAWPSRSAAATGGIALMGIKAKIVVALAVVAALVYIGRSVSRGNEAPPRVAEIPSGPDPQPTAAQPPVPEPTDSAAIDRDLDLHGTVVDLSGDPVAGASIVVVRRPGLDHGTSIVALTEVESAPVPVAPDGSFAIRLERGELVDVRISAPGFAPRRLPWRLAGGRETVILHKGRELRVRVVDREGKPVGGASVEYFLSPRPHPRFTSGVVDLPVRETNEEGRCRWEAIHASQPFVLYVSHPGFWVGNSLVDPDWQGEVEIRLEAGANVRGRVTDKTTGEPIPGAVVSAAPIRWPKSVLADEEGRYLMRGLRNLGEDGRALLFAWADGYRVATVDVTGSDECDIALERGLELVGRLVDEHRNPVAGALLTAIGGEALDLESRSAVSDADGRFLLAGLRPGAEDVLIATKPGHARLLLGFGVRTGQEPRRDLGDVLFRRGLALEGRLLDDRGEPVSLAVVRCANDANRWGQRGETCCVTDDLGRFRFRVNEPGTWRLRAELVDGRTLSQDVELEGDRFDVEFASADVHRFAVRVQDESGAPVEGATVVVWQLDSRTDETGAARFEVPTEQSSGWVAVVARESGFLDVTLRDQRYDRGDVTVVLEKGVALRGKLLDQDGHGIDGAAIAAGWGDDGQTSTNTGADGGFRLLVPSGTETTVRVGDWRHGKPRQVERREVHVSPGENDVVIRTRTIRHDRELTVRVTTPDGAPLAGCRLYCSADSREALGPTGEDGRARLEGLPAAEVVIAVQDGNGPDPDWAAPKPAKVVPEGQEIVLAFRRAVAITGRVIFPEGVTARVGVLAVRDSAVAHTVTRPDGSFHLRIGDDDLSPVDIRVVPPRRVDQIYEGPELEPAQLEGIEPGTHGLEIRLERAAD